MHMSKTLGLTLTSLLLLSLGCGLPDQDSRGQPQTEQAIEVPRLAGEGTDFMVNKPRINQIWGSQDKDVWAAGNDGMMLHWDGTIWGRVPVPTGNDLLAIWGASDKDIWAVGEAGVVIRWDGMTWARVTTPVPDTAALNDIWGTSGSNIWAVGDRGVLIHYNGSAWGAYNLPIINNLLTVWTGSSTDAWIGGDLGLLLHWDGTAWAGVASGNSQPFTHIRGTATNKVWAAKQNNEIWTYDGSKWTKLTASVYGSRLWMTADNDIWVYRSSYAQHFTTTWTPFSFGYDVTALWSAGPTTAWALTTADIMRFSSSAWGQSW